MENESDAERNDDAQEGSLLLLLEIQATNISPEQCSWLLEAESRGQGGVCSAHDACTEGHLTVWSFHQTFYNYLRTIQSLYVTYTKV